MDKNMKAVKEVGVEVRGRNGDSVPNSWSRNNKGE